MTEHPTGVKGAAPTIALASASPRRRELLARLASGFAVVPAAVDETPGDGEAPAAYALRVAEAKGRIVAAARAWDLVVGADTVVVLDGDVLGKPRDAEEATSHLRRLRGRRHDVATAVAIVSSADGWALSDIDWTGVWMRDYADDEIAAYVASGDPFDKAGAYAIQSRSFRPVAAIDGSRSNVVGLPLELTARLLAEATARFLGRGASPNPPGTSPP